MPPFQRKLTVPGMAADLPAIADFVEAACEQAAVDPVCRFDIQLAVEEACCNIIEHAYAGKGGRLTVNFETRDRDVIITLRDRGRPFDPAAVAAPDLMGSLAERPICGPGLHLMNRLMDQVRFSFDAAGNSLVMVKRDVVPTA